MRANCARVADRLLIGCRRASAAGTRRRPTLHDFSPPPAPNSLRARCLHRHREAGGAKPGGSRMRRTRFAALGTALLALAAAAPALAQSVGPTDPATGFPT